MKATYAVVLVAAFLPGCASGFLTPIKESDRQREFVETHTLTKDEAYTRLRRWAAQIYNSANEVLQMDDPESGTLVAKGVTRINRSGLGFYHLGYTLTIDIRDGRIRFTERIGQPVESDQNGVMASDLVQFRSNLDAIRASAMAALQGAPADNF